ncbi:MAG TPA: cytochrome c [Burkholderiales bacterium]|nr:cytochrome c [Burkholderiales bacterium]
MSKTLRMAISALVVAASVSGYARAAGNADRGAALHESCLGCHGTEVYAPPAAKVKSASALKKEVERWNDRYNPKFSKQEVEDLIAYLNRDFYHFAQ